MRVPVDIALSRLYMYNKSKILVLLFLLKNLKTRPHLNQSNKISMTTHHLETTYYNPLNKKKKTFLQSVTFL